LPTRPTGEDTFNLTDLYEAEKCWKQCVDICTDGAGLMVGKTRGFVAPVKGNAPECTSSHAIIHRHALAVKNVPNALQTVFDEDVKIYIL
jgi:hypothetical protein